MAIPKRPTKEQAEANKRKQQVLRTSGYNVKLDGSWGPWQEEQYRKVISKGGQKQANVGVLALPTYGYGATQLVEGLGSMQLPSISIPSASSVAPAIPIAATLAGPVYGAYELYTGQHHQAGVSPQERQAMTYAPDATRVNRPIVTSLPRDTKKTGYIGEMYVNPIMSRSAVRGGYMAAEEPKDSTHLEGGSPTTESTTNSSTASPNPQEPKKEGFKERIKSVGRNIKKGYENALIGATYVIGGGAPLALGYGAYKLFQPDPTPADSLLDQQRRQIEELEKLKSAKHNQMMIDSLKRSLSAPAQEVRREIPSQTDTVQWRPRVQNQPRTSQRQMDSLRNVYFK